MDFNWSSGKLHYSYLLVPQTGWNDRNCDVCLFFSDIYPLGNVLYHYWYPILVYASFSFKDKRRERFHVRNSENFCQSCMAVNGSICNQTGFHAGKRRWCKRIFLSGNWNCCNLCTDFCYYSCFCKRPQLLWNNR